MPSQPTPLFQSDPDDGENSAIVSDRIRARLKRANKRFHANDNIAAFVKEGEVDLLREEVTAKMAEVLKSLVIDTDNDHNTHETARRQTMLNPQPRTQPPAVRLHRSQSYITILAVSTPFLTITNSNKTK